MEIKTIFLECKTNQHDKCVKITMGWDMEKRCECYCHNIMRSTLGDHIGHTLTVASYSHEGELINLTIECTQCNVVLISADDFEEEQV